jgi:hypothetical protein
LASIRPFGRPASSRPRPSTRPDGPPSAPFGACLSLSSSHPGGCRSP